MHGAVTTSGTLCGSRDLDFATFASGRLLSMHGTRAWSSYYVGRFVRVLFGVLTAWESQHVSWKGVFGVVTGWLCRGCGVSVLLELE